MSNLIEHAKTEFRAAKWMDADGNYLDEMQGMICEHLLKLLQVFSDEGHSGTTAPYTLSAFDRLARFKPIAPLTGEDWEWTEVGVERGGSPLWQNKRASHVFKDEDGAWDIDGRVFWEWSRRPLDEDEEGYPGTKTYKSYYTCRESRVPVTFPYSPPKEPEYVYRYSDADPPALPQTEEGIIG